MFSTQDMIKVRMLLTMLVQNLLTHKTGNVLAPGVHQLKNQPHLTEHGNVSALLSPIRKTWIKTIKVQYIPIVKERYQDRFHNVHVDGSRTQGLTLVLPRQIRTKH